MVNSVVQRVPTELCGLQCVPTQRVPTQRVPTWGVFQRVPTWRPELASRIGVPNGVPNCASQRVPNWGPKTRGSSASRMSYLLRCRFAGVRGALWCTRGCIPARPDLASRIGGPKWRPELASRMASQLRGWIPARPDLAPSTLELCMEFRWNLVS